MPSTGHPSFARRLFIAALLMSCLVAVTSRGETPAPLSREAVTGHIRTGIARLNDTYWSPTLGIWLDRPGDDVRGHYDGRRNPPWWPSANAVEMLIDFMGATGSSEYEAAIASLYELQKDPRTRRARMVAELQRRKQWSEADEKAWQRELQKAAEAPAPRTGYYSDFQNEYLDDSGWWGIAWLKMYDRTKAAKYLTTARTIHAHMAGNWKPEKGGGVVWCEDADKQRPNAITNSLFLILSSRLYAMTREPEYLGWAEKTLEWFNARSLYDGTAIVDAPGHRGDYWSYNQGTFIAGLTALYQATGRTEYLDQAVKIADSVLHRSGLVLPTGVFVEKLGTGGDARLFKGICVRGLAQLSDVLRARKLHADTAAEIDRCIRSSVESLFQHSIAADGLFGAEWHPEARDRSANFNTHVSALTALVSMAGEGGRGSKDAAQHR